MNEYAVKRLVKRDAAVDVPPSKSALNRALLLAALSSGEISLRVTTNALGDDARAFLGCLSALGIAVKQEKDEIRVFGCGGAIPNRTAELDVGSAGTAARFLPAALAICGGDYFFTASEQMTKRPMGILPLLEAGGAKIEYANERGTFPFRLRSEGLARELPAVPTDESTQYASGLLLSAFADAPRTIRLQGTRTDGSYLRLSLRTMEAFGIAHRREGTAITVFPQRDPPAVYRVEPDYSSACYFLAAALLCKTRILVRGLPKESAQADRKFAALLERRGLSLVETPDGLLADGTQAGPFEGFCEDFGDFSDQALTAAALAPFASTPTQIRNVGHVRRQESDRIAAAEENLRRLGVPVSTSEDGIFISPAPVRDAVLESFGDHRAAMAFALPGLKTGGVVIRDPDCCRKTFEGFFSVLDELAK